MTRKPSISSISAQIVRFLSIVHCSNPGAPQRVAQNQVSPNGLKSEKNYNLGKQNAWAMVCLGTNRNQILHNEIMSLDLCNISTY